MEFHKESKILLLQTNPGAKKLASKLEDASLEVIFQSAIAIKPLQLSKSEKKILLNPKKDTILVCTSQHAGKFATQWFRDNSDLGQIRNYQNCISVGSATSESLKNFPVPVTNFSAFSSSEELILKWPYPKYPGQTVIFLKGEGGRDLIQRHLEMHQVTTHSIAFYKRITSKDFVSWIASCNLEEFNCLAFASGDQFKFFRKTMKEFSGKIPMLVPSIRVKNIIQKEVSNPVTSLNGWTVKEFNSWINQRKRVKFR